ncbi:hypothetical protein DH2020_013460 [Rehmannia glutinosa]|uniref:Transposase (putative) gypsy type domain-containing protein n=1 Tax=Rehmannia glutinosa TaxID=99300 RepID=A0ABR0X3N5_REHGL
MHPSSLPCTFRLPRSDRDLLIEFSTHFPPLIKMASSSNNPARPNIYSTLSEGSLHNLRINAGIPAEYELRLPGPTDVPYNPPPGFATFFVEQLEAGLRFPVPDLLGRVSRSFGIPLTQLVPNSIRLLVSFSIIIQHSQEEPTPQLWRTFYQSKTSSTPGFFYFTSKGLAKFIDGTPSSNKNWKKRFFYISSPQPWAFPTRWIDDLPHQGRGGKPTPAIISLARRLNTNPYHAQLLVDSWPLLYHFHLSPKAVDLPQDLEQSMADRLAARADNRRSSGQPIHPEGEGHIPLTSNPREQVPPASHTLAASTQPQASHSPSPPANLIRQRKRPAHAASSSGPHPIRPRLNLEDLPTGDGDSPLNIIVPELNATWVENLVTPVHERALGNADIQVRIRDMAHYASKMILTMGSIVRDARVGLTDATELRRANEILQHKYDQISSRAVTLDTELQNASTEIQSLKAQLAATEAKVKLLEDRALKAEAEIPRAKEEGRISGYAAGKAEWATEKEKFLESDEYLDQVADAALPYLEQGLLIMAKRAQAKGFTLEVPDLKEAIKELPSEAQANPVSGDLPSSSASILPQTGPLQVQPLSAHPALQTLSSDSGGSPDSSLPPSVNEQEDVVP